MYSCPYFFKINKYICSFVLSSTSSCFISVKVHTFRGSFSSFFSEAGFLDEVSQTGAQFSAAENTSLSADVLSTDVEGSHVVPHIDCELC